MRTLSSGATRDAYEKAVSHEHEREIKDDLLPRLQARYAQRGREGRSRMLDEICHDYHYGRKYAIKLLGGKLPEPSGRKKPGPKHQGHWKLM